MESKPLVPVGLPCIWIYLLVESQLKQEEAEEEEEEEEAEEEEEEEAQKPGWQRQSARALDLLQRAGQQSLGD